MTRRFVAVVVLVTIVAVVAFFVPAAVAIQNSEERKELVELQREAAIVAARVPQAGPIDDEVLRPIVDSEHRLGLYDRDGTLLGGVGPARADGLVELAIAGDFAEAYVGDDVVAVVPLRTRADGSSLAMRIEAPRAEFLDRIMILVVIAVGILVAASALAAWLARRISRPIDDLRAWASAPRDRRGDPPTTIGIAELDELRIALLDDRARIEQLLERERSFSSHVSHQLRTPVAAMRVAVETELESPRSDPHQLLEEALGQLERLESTINSLLALSRHDAEPVSDCAVDEVTAELLARWAPDFLHRGRLLGMYASPVRGRIEPAAAGHILDVLLDNALRHGTGEVSVRVAMDGDAAIVEVSDEGTAAESGDLFSDIGSDTGHGIGLRLARSLAESSAGSLELIDRPTTTFRLSVPAVRDSAST